MNCREVSRMLAEGAFDEAPAWRRLLARFHLLICRYCRRYRLQLALIKEGAERWADSLISPDKAADLAEALVKKLARPG